VTTAVSFFSPLNSPIQFVLITFISGEQISNAVLTTVILQNHMYYHALESAVARVKAMGREPHVLDIGTGTGLLALMAAKAGATRVTACEVCVC